MEAILNVGIIGTGIHGTRYARHIINDLSDFNLVAISRRSDKGAEQAETWNSIYYQNWRDLVKNPEIDAVIAVATPDLNLEIAEACVKVGKPLLVEKPLSINTSDAEKMVQCFKEADLPLTVGQTLRFNSTILALRREIDSVGNLLFFHAGQRIEKTRHAWLDDPKTAGGGVIFHTSVHIFDALRFITGREILRVYAKTRCHFTSTLEDLFWAQVEMEGGLVGTVDSSKVSMSRTARYEFVGENGQIHGDQVRGGLEYIQSQTAKVLPVDEPTQTILYLLKRWRDFLLGHAENPIPGEDGLAAVKICEACKRSAEEDRWVDVYT